MSDLGESKSFSVPKWDGKPDTCPRYIDQFEAVAEMNGMREVLDVALMESTTYGCPTESEYQGMDKSTSATDPVKKRIFLYKSNNKMCAVYVLGQETNHGLAKLKDTKSSDYKAGKIWEVIAALTKSNRPKDITAEIMLEAEIKNIEFRDANEYVDKVKDVLAKYDVAMSDTELIKIMASKVQSQTYVQMIIKHLETTPPHDFDAVCDEIAKNQRLAKATGVLKTEKPGKEVTLTSTEGTQGAFKGACGHCGEKGHKRADCPKKKGGKSDKQCPHCNKKGHDEKDCWKKHPDKAPQWFKDLQAKKKETSNVELMVAAIDLEGSERQDFA